MGKGATMRLWVRVGDSGDYQSYGDDLDALIDYLNDLSVGTVTGWIDNGPGVGFETPNYHGYDFVSLFWGDANADLVAHLTGHERAIIEAGLEEAFI
jgi:hypothetical protein